VRIVECTQYSPEWWEAKAGVPSASNFHRIFTAKTRKLSAQIDDYICELIADKANPSPPFFTERGGHTAAMRNGLNCEPDARQFYEVQRKVDVICSPMPGWGFCTTDDGRFGCSPDGLVNVADEGGLELKCPELKTHLGYLLKGELPADHVAQVHGCLVVSGRPWWDYMSYHPDARALLLRITPNDYTEALASALEVFWEKYQQALAYIEGRPYVAEQMRESIAMKGGAA
jgi:hypothetical protein